MFFVTLTYCGVVGEMMKSGMKHHLAANLHRMRTGRVDRVSLRKAAELAFEKPAVRP